MSLEMSAIHGGRCRDAEGTHVAVDPAAREDPDKRQEQSQDPKRQNAQRPASRLPGAARCGGSRL
jgi:hypothetical protein